MRDDDLMFSINRDLGVVVLHEAVAGLQGPAVGIGKIALCSVYQGTVGVGRRWRRVVVAALSTHLRRYDLSLERGPRGLNIF
ncbi:MAG: hypothetical protein ACYDDO_08400 [Acidiferrobacterales bacterium]